MRRDEAFAILAAHRDELRQTYGVTSLALFGSVARDEAGPDSDADLPVEFDQWPIGLVGFIDLRCFFERVFGGTVDLATAASRQELIRLNVARDVIDTPSERTASAQRRLMMKLMIRQERITMTTISSPKTMPAMAARRTSPGSRSDASQR